jgi:hypothetical protein
MQAERYGLKLPVEAFKPIPPPKDEEEDEMYHMGHGMGKGNKWVTGRRPEPDSESESGTESEYSDDSDSDKDKEIVMERIGESGTGLQASPGLDDTTDLIREAHRVALAATNHKAPAPSINRAHHTLESIEESPLVKRDDAVIFGEDTAATPAAVHSASETAARAAHRAAHHLQPAEGTITDNWEAVEQQQQLEEAARGLRNSPSTRAVQANQSPVSAVSAPRTATSVLSPAAAALVHGTATFSPDVRSPDQSMERLPASPPNVIPDPFGLEQGIPIPSASPAHEMHSAHEETPTSGGTNGGSIDSAWEEVHQTTDAPATTEPQTVASGIEFAGSAQSQVEEDSTTLVPANEEEWK